MTIPAGTQAIYKSVILKLPYTLAAKVTAIGRGRASTVAYPYILQGTTTTVTARGVARASAIGTTFEKVTAIGVGIVKASGTEVDGKGVGQARVNVLPSPFTATGVGLAKVGPLFRVPPANGVGRVIAHGSFTVLIKGQGEGSAKATGTKRTAKGIGRALVNVKKPPVTGKGIGLASAIIANLTWDTLTADQWDGLTADQWDSLS